MEIKVTSVTSTPKDGDAFAGQVRNSISKVANLCGWSREEREFLMGQVSGHEAVAHQWDRLQGEAASAGTMPVWEWNKFVRSATDQIVEAFYREG